MKKYKNIEYKIYFNDRIGNFCGYVKLPKGHPYIKFIDISEEIFGKNRYYVGYDKMDINCHGGLTWCRNITKKNQKDFLQRFSLGPWIGWDYAHSGDKTYLFDGREWTEGEVEKECKNVIEQLLKYE